jgi:nicotinate-nucleotide adenylyltransferase
MTTGIYGGSFNPIHLGHTSLGSWLVRQNLLDELWFLVSPHNPLKPAAGLLEDQARLRLARLAVGRKKGLRVSDFEFSLPRPSFMAHTLSCLREAYPEPHRQHSRSRNAGNANCNATYIPKRGTSADAP